MHEPVTMQMLARTDKALVPIIRRRIRRPCAEITFGHPLRRLPRFELQGHTCRTWQVVDPVSLEQLRFCQHIARPAVDVIPIVRNTGFAQLQGDGDQVD